MQYEEEKNWCLVITMNEFISYHPHQSSSRYFNLNFDSVIEKSVIEGRIYKMLSNSNS